MPNTKAPNFEELFFETFAKQLHGVEYRVRRDSNFPHDLHFLRSLLRDARFQFNAVTHEKQTIEIKLSRARWELRDQVNQCNLIEIPSVLKFTRVRKTTFRTRNTTTTAPFSGALYEETDALTPDTRCEIDGFYFGEASLRGLEPNLELVLYGYPGNWELRIYLDRESFGVSIKDVVQN